jgi:pyrroline-5-carboxylate reductase
MPAPVLLIGGGRMGQALVKGWIAASDIGPIEIIEPAPSPGLLALMDGTRVRLVDGPPYSGTTAPPGLSLVIAIKPQMFDAVLDPYRDLASADTLVLSIAAGRSLAELHRLLGDQASMVRAMPNTPAEVGRGITALVADPKARSDARNRAEILMRAVGDIAWVDGEDAINATTAISGSGPAYVFLLVEALAKAALVQGLPPDQAAQFARATIIGAGRLLEQSADSPTALREAVTSPGGTTAAALGVLMAKDTGLEPLVMRAVHEAVMRARALAG